MGVSVIFRAAIEIMGVRAISLFRSLSCTMAEYLASIYGTEKDKYVFISDNSHSLLLINVSCSQGQLLFLFQGRRDIGGYGCDGDGSTHGIVWDLDRLERVVMANGVLEST